MKARLGLNLVTRFLELLKEYPSRMFRPDAKAQVSFDYYSGRITSGEELAEYVKASYDLTPRGIIEKLHLLDVDYNQTSAYGHFGKPGLPWEE